MRETSRRFKMEYNQYNNRGAANLQPQLFPVSLCGRAYVPSAELRSLPFVLSPSRCHIASLVVLVDIHSLFQVALLLFLQPIFRDEVLNQLPVLLCPVGINGLCRTFVSR